jgi:hypothetical protein
MAVEFNAHDMFGDTKERVAVWYAGLALPGVSAISARNARERNDPSNNESRSPSRVTASVMNFA